jgi:hypothetical protein
VTEGIGKKMYIIEVDNNEIVWQGSQCPGLNYISGPLKDLINFFLTSFYPGANDYNWHDLDFPWKVQIWYMLGGISMVG